MELTRRDAIAALSAVGVAAGGGAVLYDSSERGDDGPLAGDRRATLVATARVLYPSRVENVEGFVGRYVAGLAGERPERVAGIADAVDYLDDYAEAWYDERFLDLSASARSEALERMGADTADPDPDGADVERVRYYLVNELLYALYASPTGGKLVGLENPQGHPGGTESYRRPPSEDRDG